MAISMKNYNPEDRIVCLAKGDPGSGKTIGVVSWAIEGPMYIFDIDHRLAPVRKMYRDRPDVVDNIFFDQYDGYHDMYPKLEEIHDETKRNGFKCRYKSLVVDGLTPIGRNLINTAIEQRIEYADDKEKKKMVMRAGVYVAQIEDYMGESQGISNILALLRSTVFEKARVNIFLTAHVVEVETRNQRNEITHVSRSLLTGGKKIAIEIPAYFNECWHFDVAGSAGKPSYHIVTSHGGEDFAKTALTLPTKVEWTAPKLLYEEVMRYAKDASLTKEEAGETRTKFNQPKPETALTK